MSIFCRGGARSTQNILNPFHGPAADRDHIEAEHDIPGIEIRSPGKKLCRDQTESLFFTPVYRVKRSTVDRGISAFNFDKYDEVSLTDYEIDLARPAITVVALENLEAPVRQK